jgi:polysaccharide biosynthesis/export protein
MQMASELFCGVSCVSKFVVAMSTAFLLTACASMPSSGPTLNQIAAASSSKSSKTRYDIVEITPAVANLVRKSVARASSGRFSKLALQPAQGIGVGDTLEVTLYESSSGGLFAPRTETDAGGMPHVKLPPQIVDRFGMISVPYAGSIKVAGRSPRQVQATIVKRLSSRALEPQAIVSVIANESRLVTVTGDVEKAGRIPLNIGSERLLDSLALAGGARGRPDDSYVKLTRGTYSQEMLLSELANSPHNNVQLQPGDQIFVYQNPQRFVALGASINNSEVSFASNNLTLSEAIGRAGGLDDRRSDPAGVFVFRYEARDVYQQLFNSKATQGEEYPVVYQLDLQKPDSLLAAQRFPIKNKDVVYFANSPSTELSKFLALIGSGLGVAGSGSATIIKVAK